MANLRNFVGFLFRLSCCSYLARGLVSAQTGLKLILAWPIQIFGFWPSIRSIQQSSMRAAMAACIGA